MPRKWILATLAFAIVAAVLVYNSDAMKEARFVNALVARNIEARGGAATWEKVSTLRLAGQMDLGQEMVVPYMIDQKRPDKMCFEFEFDGQTASQCTNADGGWKIAPFRGRPAPEPMTADEYRDTADATDPYGLLYSYKARDIDIDLVGQEQVNGRETFKLELTLPRGAVRWLYLDTETALEVKLENTRIIAGRERKVETFYSDWRESEGLLIAHRQDTRTEGDEELHFLTVDSVVVNPVIDDARFDMPKPMNASNGDSSSNGS